MMMQVNSKEELSCASTAAAGTKQVSEGGMHKIFRECVLIFSTKALMGSIF